MKFLWPRFPRLLEFLRKNADVSAHARATAHAGVFVMLDTIFIASALVFFAVMAAYAIACSQL